MWKKTYNQWFNEYFSDLINLFKIVIKHEKKIENNNDNFNDFCEFLYEN
jgi:hypothetical protein